MLCSGYARISDYGPTLRAHGLDCRLGTRMVYSRYIDPQAMILSLKGLSRSLWAIRPLTRRPVPSLWALTTSLTDTKHHSTGSVQLTRAQPARTQQPHRIETSWTSRVVTPYLPQARMPICYRLKRCSAPSGPSYHLYQALYKPFPNSLQTAVRRLCFSGWGSKHIKNSYLGPKVDNHDLLRAVWSPMGRRERA